jgi:16S rRNA C967 or C1407 C5-methylase (RsmB/RsmF family)
VFATCPAPEWSPPFVQALEAPQGAGRHPLHEAGDYYCLDLASVFMASVIQAVTPPLRTVLDTCAAPGGKSILAWRLFHPELLISNEVIGKRTAPLIANLRRCGVAPVIVTSADTERLAKSLPRAMDLVLVDAPCSGQSLPAKGVEAGGAFHPATVNMNSNRQKRIAANAARTVAPGGHLAYMTCTFSREENEGVIEWLVRRFPHLQPVAVPVLEAHQSHLAAFPCYRLWPFEGHGAGGFTALLRNTLAGEAEDLDLGRLRIVWGAGAS